MTSFSEFFASQVKTANSPRLKLFYWKGISPVGKVVTSKQLAYTETEVRQQIADSRIKLIRIEARTPSTLILIKNHINETDIHYFTKQLATMLSAGIPIVNALRLVRVNNKDSIRSLTSNIIKLIESGTSLSEALQQVHPQFRGVYSSLIEAGEMTGKLPELLERISDYQEKSLKLKKNMQKALLYPGLIVSVSVAVVSMMLVVVIPEFENVFSAMNAELPEVTQYLLFISRWTQNNIAEFCLTIFFALFLLQRLYKKSRRLRLWMNKKLLVTPIIGDIVIKSSLAQFSRTLATGFSSGIPVVKALNLSANSVKNAHYQVVINKVLDSVTSGAPIHQAMLDTREFPPLAIQIVMSGEETGALDTVLLRLATIYESEVDDLVENFSKILEPVLIVILGLILGTVVLSLYLPIFNLMSVLG